MKRLIGIFGASGFAREVLPVLRQHIAREGGMTSEVVFVDRVPGPPLSGVQVVAEETFLTSSAERAFVVAIADGKVRRRVQETAVASGAVPLTVRADSAEVLDSVELGAGSILCGKTIALPNSRIGAGLHLNIYSYVAHDCVIGDWVTFAPRVACNGNVLVQDFAYLGTGAVIRQGAPDAPIVIGAGAVVGMGAVVTKSVPPGVTVVGNPARPLQKV